MIKIHKVVSKDKLLALDNIEDIKVNAEVSMGIDCSSSCTGLCIMSIQGIPLYTLAVHRDANDDFIFYKIKLKKLFIEMFRDIGQNITQIYYEEPFLGYAESSKVLMALRTTVQEIKYEYTPEFDHIKFKEVVNTTWKKLFLDPIKLPSGTPAQKAAVRKKLEEYFPVFKELTQDEVDAASLALVCTQKKLMGQEEDFTSNKKPKAFKFNIKFIGSDSDEEMFEEYGERVDTWKLPKKLKGKACRHAELNGRGQFNNRVYEVMGDTDDVLVLKYKSSHYGNIALEYRIGSLVTNYKYIYAIIWRKTRKAAKVVHSASD